MAKALYIAEKPSVARTFASCLDDSFKKKDGYEEGESNVVTWCVGHLVTMSYPEVYDEKYHKWRMETLPFLPKEFLYEVIPGVKKQFEIVKGLLNREDIDQIYVCTDSGREGEYIYRLVAQMAGVQSKNQLRVWINSQTKEEILKGINEAKPLAEYDNLSASAYLRAKEDYLMGINFSRLLSIKYGRNLASILNKKYCVISVGRVMTCVLGMVVRREREIRDFKKQIFYRVFADVRIGDSVVSVERKGEKKGFDKKDEAKEFIIKEGSLDGLKSEANEDSKESVSFKGIVSELSKKKEKKNPPLLYNLAELQNDASKLFKISPDQTLQAVQELYEKRLVTYPRTDARVLSSAIAKEIDKNLKGLATIPGVGEFAKEILAEGRYKKIAKSKYVDDKKITDHYAIIPTGAGLNQIQKLNSTLKNVYEVIMRRFLAIFYDPAEYDKINLVIKHNTEEYQASAKSLKKAGFLKVMNYSFSNKNKKEENENDLPIEINVKKGDEVGFEAMWIKEGETSPPKRYTSGTIILAMENAGSLIEDEELREQIKGSGIGTAATRGEIIKKLIKNQYISNNSKTQVLKPTLMGELIFDVVSASIRSLLNPELTASWEKGLTLVSEGEISSDEYMEKLENFVGKHTKNVKETYNNDLLNKRLIITKNIYK